MYQRQIVSTCQASSCCCFCVSSALSPSSFVFWETFFPVALLRIIVIEFLLGDYGKTATLTTVMLKNQLEEVPPSTFCLFVPPPPVDGPVSIFDRRLRRPIRGGGLLSAL